MPGPVDGDGVVVEGEFWDDCGEVFAGVKKCVKKDNGMSGAGH